MEKLVANLSGKVTEKTLQGRKYLVAPVSMLVEGVLAGSAGAIYYDGIEISKSVAAWNARPITVGHPELPSGEKISGCTPESLDQLAVGMILNTRYVKSKKKLQAEAWFDKDLLDKVPGGELIANALATDTKVEVSTGLFVDAVPVTNGEHNGKSYVAQAKNFRPDHLAILLHEEGACSIADGAGLLVNKKADNKAGCHPFIVANAKSLTQTVAKVREAVFEKYHRPSTEMTPGVYPYIEDITTKDVIFSVYDSEGMKFHKQNYAISEDKVTLLGELMEVTRKVTYQPLVANKAKQMTRDELTAAIGAEHKDFIANMSDEQVAAFAKLKSVAPAPVAPEQAKQPEVAPVANSLNEVVATLPVALQAQMKDLLAANAKIRKGHIDVILANKASQFSAEELDGFSLPVLEKLAGLANVPVANAAPAPAAPIYAGSPAPVTNAKVTETGFGLPSTL